MTIISNSTAAFFRQSQHQMGNLRAEAERLQRQISTGERLERSSDDPLASARLRTLSRADRLAEVDSANATLASEEIAATSDRIGDIADRLIRARELALQAANGATSAEARAIIAAELDQLGSEILASANAIGNSGRALFAGDSAGPAYSVDAAGTVSYTGAAIGAALPIGEGVELERGITGPAVFEFNHAGSTTDVFAFIGSLAEGLRGAASDPGQFARDALSGLDSAIDTLGRGQTILGVRLAWIDTIQQNQILRSEDRAQEGGAIGGTDLASAISRLQQTLTILEASQASFARLSSLSLFDAI